MTSPSAPSARLILARIALVPSSRGRFSIAEAKKGRAASLYRRSASSAAASRQCAPLRVVHGERRRLDRCRFFASSSDDGIGGGGGGRVQNDPSDEKSTSSSSSSPKPQRGDPRSDHAHCVDLVRTRDAEGYLCGLLMPPSSRHSYFAVRAFNVEVASVKDGGGLASTRSRRVPGHFGEDGTTGMDSSLASRLRMQWWRDAVAEVYENDDGKEEAADAAPGAGGPSPAGFLSSTFASTRGNNPVVRELRRAARSSDLTRRFLERLVDARERDLDVRQPDGLEDLVRYGEEAHSSLMYLALECADVRDDAADEVAYHAGVGIGVVTSLRSAVARGATGETALPADVMGRHGADGAYLMNPPVREGEEPSPEQREADRALRAAVRDVAHAAGAHLMHARGIQSSVPKEGRAALLPAVGALSYLKALEKAEFDLLSPDLMAKEGLSARLERLRVTFSLGRAWLTGVF